MMAQYSNNITSTLQAAGMPELFVVAFLHALVGCVGLHELMYMIQGLVRITK